MDTKFTSRSAKTFLLEHVLAQAALDDISFSAFELKLLRENQDQPVDDRQLEEFEFARRDEFFAKVAECLNRARQKFEKEHTGSREFKEAISLAGDLDDYFSIILWETFTDELITDIPEKRDWKDNLIFVGVGITLCSGLIGGILYWLDNAEIWQDKFNDFLANHPAVANLHLPYISWLQSPTGWFQLNGGKYLLAAVMTLGAIFWARVLMRLFSRDSERE